MRALIVDDEAPARRRLARMLERIDGVEIAGEASFAEEALAAIERTGPDVVFLDIHMPGASGLHVAEEARRAAIVFVTAHAEHAARAFELDSVDYLLKPVRIERLEEAVRRVRSRRSAPVAAPSIEPPRVIAHERGAVVIVDAREVTRFRASDKYTAFVADGRELLTEESLVSLEERLAPFGFARVHRAEVVLLSAVKAFLTEDGAHSIRLTDGQVVPVSRRLSSQLRDKLGL